MADKVFAGNAVPIVKPVSRVHVRSRKKPLHRDACPCSRVDVPAKPILFVFARLDQAVPKLKLSDICIARQNRTFSFGKEGTHERRSKSLVRSQNFSR